MNKTSIAYDDYISSFEELLVRGDTFIIHQRHLRTLATRMYKISHNLSQFVMREFFTGKNVNYNTRSNVTIDIDDNDKVCKEYAQGIGYLH